jgi:hypothetical protein
VLAQDVARGLHRARQRLAAGDTYFRGLLERVEQMFAIA